MSSTFLRMSAKPGCASSVGRLLALVSLIHLVKRGSLGSSSHRKSGSVVPELVEDEEELDEEELLVVSLPESVDELLPTALVVGKLVLVEPEGIPVTEPVLVPRVLVPEKVLVPVPVDATAFSTSAPPPQALSVRAPQALSATVRNREGKRG